LGEVKVPIDPDGSFSIEGLPDGEYSIYASSDDQAYVPQSWRGPLVITAGTKIGGIDFLLQAAGAISGRVVDVQGRPVAGQDLWIQSATYGMRVTTGADGRYRTWGALPPNRTWTVRSLENRGYSSMFYNNLLCYAGCLEADAVHVRTRAGETTDGVDFVLRAHGRIRGRILDSVTGELVLGIGRVEGSATAVPGYGVVTTTGSAGGGRYDVAVPDGGATVTVSFNSAQAPYRSGTYPGTITIHPETRADGYDIRVDPIGARLNGRVVARSNGQPIGGVPVYVLDASGKQVLSAVAAADGTWRTEPRLLPGSYVVQTPGKRGWNGATSAPIPVTGTEVIGPIDLRLDPSP
jgi:hypothetical protein